MKYQKLIKNKLKKEEFLDKYFKSNEELKKVFNYIRPVIVVEERPNNIVKLIAYMYEDEEDDDEIWETDKVFKIASKLVDISLVKSMQDCLIPKYFDDLIHDMFYELSHIETGETE